jgi:cytochrome d ubiquinol oxidase subunit I
VSSGVYWLSALLVFIGGHLSAFWIVVANSWMQTPAGYVIGEGGKIILGNFFDAVFNPSTVVRYVHTIFASWVTCSVMLAGIAGYYVRKGLHGETARTMLKIGIILFAFTPLLQLGAGHAHAVKVINLQPEKAAALEGHFSTMKGAPIYALGYVDEGNRKTYGVYIPKGLSFLYNLDWNSEIKGLNDFPQEDWPPVNFVFQVYHIMVGAGVLMIVFGLLGGYFLWTKKIDDNRWYLALLPLMIPLPHIAHETGWMSAEVGRQPWIIYKLMKTGHAVSVVVTPGEILFSLIMFFLLYLLLAVIFVKIFIKIVQKGPAVS